jgi:hypothetical protein
MYVVYLTVYSGEKLPPFYIGSSSILNIEKGYKGSVVSKKYKDIFIQENKDNPSFFEVDILSRHDTREEAFMVELLLQKKFNVVKSEMFFNESYASINGMFGRDVTGENNPMFGKKHSEHTKKTLKEKRGLLKRYEITEEHKKITSLTHKNKIVSDETKELISKNRKGKNCGINNYKFGKPLTDEAKEKLRNAQLGKKHTDETKKKISEINKGKILSEETKKKISDAKKGKKRNKFSDEWIRNLSLSKKGRVMSDEAKKKLIDSKTGMKYKKSICPHCNKEGGGGNMARYHFENCKFKIN